VPISVDVVAYLKAGDESTDGFVAAQWIPQDEYDEATARVIDVDALSETPTGIAFITIIESQEQPRPWFLNLRDHAEHLSSGQRSVKVGRIDNFYRLSGEEAYSLQEDHLLAIDDLESQIVSAVADAERRLRQQ
jgi:hypothetical protein